MLCAFDGSMYFITIVVVAAIAVAVAAAVAIADVQPCCHRRYCCMSIVFVNVDAAAAAAALTADDAGFHCGVHEDECRMPHS